jgi:DNA polymerase-3 subunit delta
VVLLVHAERLLDTKRESAAAAKGLTELEAYLKRPSPETSLIVVSETLAADRPARKLLERHAVVVECTGVEGSSAARWVREQVGKASVRIDPGAVNVLVERAGDDPTRLRADLERLLLYIGEQKVITQEDVLSVVGPAVGTDRWGLTNAIERSETATALRELASTLDAGVIPVMVLGQLAWCVRAKLPAERVADGVNAVFRTDLALKSSGGNPRVLLERLVVELCRKSSPRESGLGRSG